MRSITQHPSRHAIETQSESIPQANLDAAKLLMLDTLAVARAERQHVSCREFLAALVLGCDITHRFAAAAARLLKLNVGQTQHALGLAFLQASGTQQANIQPSLAERRPFRKPVVTGT